MRADGVATNFLTIKLKETSTMKLLKIVLITIGIYAGLVVIFESLLGYFQPQSQTTLVIITDDGE